MKWKKKYNICRLLAGPILLISSCSQQQKQVEILAQKHFQNFSSSSAVEFDNGHLYFFGDDAPYLMQTDTYFRITDTVYFINDTSRRIDKAVKPDIEAAAILTANGEKALLGFGSLSTSNRKQLFKFPFNNLRQYQIISLQPLFDALGQKDNVNIEGATTLANQLILANRANHSFKTNYFFVVGSDTSLSHFQLKNKIQLALPAKKVAGISGLAYYAPNDVLFFCASQEETTSTYADGEIGNSYIGMIKGFSKKIQQKNITPDQFINLANEDKNFLKQKIEGITLLAFDGNTATLVLTADNDNGSSNFFKIKWQLIQP